MWYAHRFPLQIFALAHAHHPFINVQRGMRRSVACQWFLLQASFTYLFGVFASVVYIKTRSVWVAVAAHAVANLFGFPRLMEASPRVMAAHALGLSSFLTFTWTVYQQIVDI
ncbi:MAG: CPBP family glutamic-type intramembrane protease [bacterium]